MQFLSNVNWSNVLSIILGLNTVIILFFIVTEDRNIFEIYSWILIFTLFPILGILLFLFFGRNWKSTQLKMKQLISKVQPFLDKNLFEAMQNEQGYFKTLYKIFPDNKIRQISCLLRETDGSLLTMQNKIQIFQSGEDKFKALITDLKNAKREINMMYFIWQDDSLTRQIRDVLTERAKSGVKIRVIYDGIGSIFLSRKYLHQMKSSGIEIYPFWSNFMGFNNRNHRKIVIIDQITAYTGGMNMGKEYVDGGNRFQTWRDTHIRIEGEGVIALQSAFALSWYLSKKEILTCDTFRPKIFKKNLPVQFSLSGPDLEGEGAKRLYFSLIAEAESSIYIQTPYFVPDPVILETLKTTAMSGVDVRIMVTGVPDKKIPYWAAYSFFPSVLKSGVKIYQYKKGFLHSKTMVMDDEVSVIGTANMDVRSLKLNYEINTVIYDKDTAKKMKKDYLNDIKDCEELTFEQTQKTSYFIHLRNSICRLFEPLL